MNEDAMLDIAFESRFEDTFEPTHDHMERDCDEDYIPEHEEYYEDDDSYADGQALASAGWGTDEDYGFAEDVY